MSFSFEDLQHEGQDLLALRNLASTRVRALLQDTRAVAETRLQVDGNGTACAEALSAAEDEIIKGLYALACRATGLKTPETSLSIVATGGYGRATLAPGSDIDLLFLVPDGRSKVIDKVVEFLLYALWDSRQKVGHATRTIEDCLSLARTDNTIMTSILEARYICGNRSLSEEMTQRFRKSVVQKSAKQFVTDKLAERDLRHSRYGESRYAVEPDIKDGKGGLRDLHTLFWIAKFLFDANSLDELVAKGVFTRTELATFRKAENFLWAVRCHLHSCVARRRQAQL
jgi:[protein-PII] uridylyltransferase